MCFGQAEGRTIRGVTLTTTAARNATRIFVIHVFELAMSMAYFFVGIAWLADPTVPERSPIGQAVDHWSVFWSTLYVIGAPAVVIGLWRGQAQIRAFGLILLATGALMQIIALLALGVGDWRIGAYVAGLTAFSVRASTLLRGGC